jgi:predicted outer membrane repeat protein
MSWMGSHGVGLGAGSAPAGLRRNTAHWAAGGAAVAAAVAAGMMAAPSALAVATIPVPCSVAALNSAISAAPSNAILVLHSGCVYRLTAALPVITRNLTIDGSNDTITAFTGHYTILTDNGATVALSQLRITDADSPAPRAMTAPAVFVPVGPAGAIANIGDGALSLTGVTMADNTGIIGGAIFNNTGSSLTVASSTFTGNEATGALGGGAIANAAGATMTVSGSTFLHNQATEGAGGAIDSMASLGATSAVTANVPASGAVTVNSPASTFTDNTAASTGGAISVAAGSLSVTGATFSENHASEGDGGGVALGAGVTATVAQSGFTGNVSEISGGAVAVAGVEAEVAQSGLGHASADGMPAGGSLALTSDTLSRNVAQASGGGLFAAGGTTTLNTTQVFGNQAVAGTGGGIDLTGGTVRLTNNSLVSLNRPNNCTGVFCPA